MMGLLKHVAASCSNKELQEQRQIALDKGLAQPKASGGLPTRPCLAHAFFNAKDTC